MACPRYRVLSVLSMLSCHVWMSRQSWQLSFLSCPVSAALSQQPCPQVSWLRCPVLTVMFWPYCPLCPVQAHLLKLTCQTDLSRLTCGRQSCLGFPITAVLFRLSCPGRPVLYVLSRLSCRGWILETDLSSQPFWADLSRLSCPSGHVSDVLSRLSCQGCPSRLYDPNCPCSHGRPVLPSCPVRAELSWRLVQTDLPRLSPPIVTQVVMPQMFYPNCTVMAILSWLYYHGCTVRLSCPRCPVLAVIFWPSCPLYPDLPVLSQLSSPALLARLSCFRCPVPAVLSQLSSPNCHFPAVRTQHSGPQLFCPRCPVFFIMFILSCPIWPSRILCPKIESWK